MSEATSPSRSQLRRVLLRVFFVAVATAPFVGGLLRDRRFIYAFLPLGTCRNIFEPSWAFLGLAIGLTLAVSSVIEGAANALSSPSWRRDLIAATVSWVVAFGAAIVALVQLAYTMALFEDGTTKDAFETVLALKWNLLHSPRPLNPVHGPTCSAHLFAVIAAPAATLVLARLRGLALGWQSVVVGLGWFAIAGPNLLPLHSVRFLPNTGGTEICIVETCHSIWAAKWFLLGAAALSPLLLRGIDALEGRVARWRAASRS